MYYVYILRDEENKLYIGYSSNLRQRLTDHLNRKVYTTKRMKKPKLIYYEAYNEESLAKEREKKLKNFGSSYSGLVKRLKIKKGHSSMAE